MDVEIRAQGDGAGGFEAQDPGAVIETGQRGRIDGGRRADDVIGGVSRGERLEAERGVIPEELTADSAEDPRSDHAVRHQRRPVGGQEAHRRSRSRGAQARRGVRIGVHPCHHEGAGADARDVAGDELGQEGPAATDDDLGTAGHGKRTHGLGVISAGGAVAVELEDGGVERDRRGVRPAALRRGGGQRVVVIEADAGARMEDPGVGVGVGGIARGAVGAFDAHLAEDVDQARTEAGTEGGGRRLAALQDQDGTAVAVHVTRTGHERAAAEGVRRIGPEGEGEVTEAGVSYPNHEGISRTGQLRASGRRIQGQRAGTAAEEELGAAGAPRCEACRRQRPPGVGTEIPVAATETGHVGRHRERGGGVEREHAGTGADHREPVKQVIERGLPGGGADADRREVEGARGPDLERRAAEIGGGTQAEGGRRIDDHGGAGGAEGRGVLVDADGSLLDVEATRPTRIGGVVVEQVIPDAGLGQTARAFQHVPVEDIRRVVVKHGAIADHHLAFQVKIVAEAVGDETHLRRVHRTEGVRPVVRAEGTVRGGAAAVTVGHDGDGSAEDEILAGGGEIGPGVVGAGAERAVVEEVVARAEDVVIGVADPADLTALHRHGRTERRVDAVETQDAIARLDERRRAAHGAGEPEDARALLDAQRDGRRTSEARRTADGEIVGVGGVRTGSRPDDQARALGRRTAHDRERSGKRVGGSCGGGAGIAFADDTGEGYVGEDRHAVGEGLAGVIIGTQQQLSHLAAVVIVQPVAAERDCRRPRRARAVKVETAAIELDRPADGVGRIGELEIALPMDGQPGRGDLAAHTRNQAVAAHVDHAFDRGRAVAEVKGGGVEIDASRGVTVDRDEATAAYVDLSAGEGGLIVTDSRHTQGMDVDRSGERRVAEAAREVGHRRGRQSVQERQSRGGVTGREGARERGVLNAIDVGIGEEAVARRVEHPDRQESLGVAQRGAPLDEQFLPLQVDAAELVGVLADGEGGLALADQTGGGEDDLPVGGAALKVDRGALADRDDPDFFAGDSSRGVDEVDGGAAQEHRRRVTPLVLRDRGREVRSVEAAGEGRVGDILRIVEPEGGTRVEVHRVDLRAGVVSEAAGGARVQSAEDMEGGSREVSRELQEILGAAGLAVTEDDRLAGVGLVAVKANRSRTAAEGEAVVELRDADLQRGGAGQRPGRSHREHAGVATEEAIDIAGAGPEGRRGVKGIGQRGHAPAAVAEEGLVDRSREESVVHRQRQGAVGTGTEPVSRRGRVRADLDGRERGGEGAVELDRRTAGGEDVGRRVQADGRAAIDHDVSRAGVGRGGRDEGRAFVTDVIGPAGTEQDGAVGGDEASVPGTVVGTEREIRAAALLERIRTDDRSGQHEIIVRLDAAEVGQGGQSVEARAEVVVVIGEEALQAEGQRTEREQLVGSAALAADGIQHRVAAAGDDVIAERDALEVAGAVAVDAHGKGAAAQVEVGRCRQGRREAERAAPRLVAAGDGQRTLVDIGRVQ